jgi:hypothetical protein
MTNHKSRIEKLETHRAPSLETWMCIISPDHGAADGFTAVSHSGGSTQHFADRAELDAFGSCPDIDYQSRVYKRGGDRMTNHKLGLSILEAIANCMDWGHGKHTFGDIAYVFCRMGILSNRRSICHGKRLQPCLNAWNLWN